MMSVSKILLPLSFLALQPTKIASLMYESSMIHPSIQAFSLNNNETTTTVLPSPVDFVGTVETMEPVVVPVSPSAIWDTIVPPMTSLQEDEEVKMAASVAAATGFGIVLAIGVIAFSALACFLLQVMATAIFQGVLPIVQGLAAHVDRYDGNNIHRILSLPMSGTYLQIIPRAPRALALYGCRDMVPTFVTALILRAPRALVVYACHAIVPVSTTTALIVRATRTLTIYAGHVTALVLRAPRTLTTYACRAMVPTNTTTAIIVRATRTLSIYAGRVTALVLRATRTLTIYATRDVAARPAGGAAEDSLVLKFLRLLLDALCTVVQELIKVIVGEFNRLVGYVFAIFEKEDEAEEPEPEEDAETETEEAEQAEDEEPDYPQAPTNQAWDPNGISILGAFKKKLAKKRYLEEIRKMRAQDDDMEELVEKFGGLSLGN